MSLKADVRRSGDVSIIDLSGRITLGEGSGLVRSTIKDLVNSGQKNLLVNLKNVTYIDSAGLGELVGSYATVTNTGGGSSCCTPKTRCTTSCRSPNCTPFSSPSMMRLGVAQLQRGLGRGRLGAGGGRALVRKAFDRPHAFR